MKYVYFLVFVCACLILAPLASPVMAEEAVVAAEKVEAEKVPEVYKVGSVAKGLIVANAEGQSIDIVKNLNGKMGMLVFMNTACSACLSEIKVAQSIYLKNKNKVEMIVVSVDFGDYAKIQAYKDSNYFEGMWVQDKEFVVPTKFGFSYTPAMVILDKDGKVLFSKAGFQRPKAAEFKKEVLAVIQ